VSGNHQLSWLQLDDVLQISDRHFYFWRTDIGDRVVAIEADKESNISGTPTWIVEGTRINRRRFRGRRQEVLPMYIFEMLVSSRFLFFALF